MAFSQQKLWGAEILYYTDLNNEFNNIYTYATPSYLEDYSANVSQFRTSSVPDEASLPTTLSGELEVLRGEFKRRKGSAYWGDIPPVVTVGTYGDYATLAAAIAASKSRIMLVSNITTTAEIDFTFSNGMILGQGFKIQGTSAITGSILEISGDENLVDVHVEGTHTTGTTTNGLELTGDKNFVRSYIAQNGAGGTITNAINDGGSNNIIEYSVEDKAGTITNIEA